jgi:hypothetical protein
MGPQEIRNLQEAYLDVYEGINAMNPNSRFVSMAQQREYSANQIGSKEFSDRGGHAALKAGGGQAALKSGSSVSDVLHAGKRALSTKRSQEFRTASLQRLSGANKPAATAKVEPSSSEKPGESTGKIAAAAGGKGGTVTSGTKYAATLGGKKGNVTYDDAGKKTFTADSYGYDAYDIILSHLLDEGYADTEQAAEAIMVNMSEDWRESIVEGIVDAVASGAGTVVGTAQRAAREIPKYVQQKVKNVAGSYEYARQKADNNSSSGSTKMTVAKNATMSGKSSAPRSREFSHGGNPGMSNPGPNFGR